MRYYGFTYASLKAMASILLNLCKSEGETGLGLSIVKNAALLMNGEILLSSSPGKGTSGEFFPLSRLNL